MSNKWIWLAIENRYGEEDILGAFTSKNKAMQCLNEYSEGAKLNWRELANGDFLAKSHGYECYARLCLFDEGE